MLLGMVVVEEEEGKDAINEDAINVRQYSVGEQGGRRGRLRVKYRGKRTRVASQQYLALPLATADEAFPPSSTAVARIDWYTQSSNTTATSGLSRLAVGCGGRLEHGHALVEVYCVGQVRICTDMQYAVTIEDPKP
jgi:hypothetical protein